jgi:hypothetical protein
MLRMVFAWAIILGVVGAYFWARYARWLGVSRMLAITLAPLGSASIVLPILSFHGHLVDIWTFVPIASGAVPSVLTTALLLRQQAPSGPHPRRLWTIALLIPGLLIAVAGLRPGTLRYRAAVDSVNRAAPFVREYLAQHARCPAFSELPPLADTSLHFSCENQQFGFCIRRHPYEEQIQCWSSVTGKWWFEQTFLQAGPRPQLPN